MAQKVLFLVFLCLWTTVAAAAEELDFSAFEAENVMDVIQRACKNVRNCPNSKYASHKGGWNVDAVMSSDAIRFFKEGRVPLEKIYKFFKNEFCCQNESCLLECGLFTKVEKPIVQNFPRNADALFDLRLPEMEKYRSPVEDYISKNGFERTAVFPAEIEEFFDYLHQNDDRLTPLLKESQRQA